jgi:hypothetical protein
MGFKRFAVDGCPAGSCQNIAAGCVKKSHHGRMFEPALNRDGIEFLLDGIETSYQAPDTWSCGEAQSSVCHWFEMDWR